jgi:hypothetical protein
VRHRQRASATPAALSFLYFPVNNSKKTGVRPQPTAARLPVSCRIKARNARERRHVGRLTWPWITGRNRTKTGKRHNPGFARCSTRAIVNAIRCVRSSALSPFVPSPRLRGEGTMVCPRIRMGEGGATHNPLTHRRARQHRVALSPQAGRGHNNGDNGGRVRGSSPNRSRSFPSHDVKQPRSSRSRGAFLRPGFASLLHSPRIEGWAERRETFGCSAKHPWDTP